MSACLGLGGPGPCCPPDLWNHLPCGVLVCLCEDALRGFDLEKHLKYVFSDEGYYVLILCSKMPVSLGYVSNHHPERSSCFVSADSSQTGCYLLAGRKGLPFTLRKKAGPKHKLSGALLGGRTMDYGRFACSSIGVAHMNKHLTLCFDTQKTFEVISASHLRQC